MNKPAALTRALRAAGLLLAACLYLLPDPAATPGFYDEGIAVYGAARVLGGDVPYRDFWTIYPPAQFYALAGVFRLFGASILAERLWDTLNRGLIVLAAGWLAREAGNGRAAWLAGIFAALWLGSLRFYGYPGTPALWLCLAGAALTCRLAREGDARPGWLALNGALTATAVLFKHEMGLLALVVLGGAILILPRFNLRRMLPFAAGAAAALFPFAAVLGAAAGPGTLVSDLITFPLTVFPATRSLPFPPPILHPGTLLDGSLTLTRYLSLSADRLAFYVPFAVLGLTLYAPREGVSPAGGGRPAWTAAALGGAFLLPAFVRSDAIHLTPALIVCLSLCAVHVCAAAQGKGVRRASILVLFLTGLILVKPAAARLEAVQGYLQSEIAPHGIGAAQWVAMDPEQAAAVAYVQAHVPPGKRIFVGNAAHDRILLNDIVFYFLAGRDAGTGYYELHPGFATTAAVQQQIVRDLEDAGVRTVVLFARFAGSAGAAGGGAVLLDEYIRENFSQVEQFGDYSIWQR
jgi:hypothetical protein